MVPTIILISCSDHKRTGAVPAEGDSESVLARVGPHACNQLLATRRRVYESIRTGQLRALNIEIGQRVSEAYNSALVCGPELGGSDETGVYAPAHGRYGDGRFFSAADSTLEGAGQTAGGWGRAWGGPVWTLIVSGLYGLLTPSERIQCYSCHLSDVDSETGQNLAGIWRPVLTNALLDFARDVDARAVVDLLSEDTYRESFDWRAIYSSGLVAYHRCFAKMAGPQRLRELGAYFANEFLIHAEPRLPDMGRFFSRAYLPDGEQMLFEPELYVSDEHVAREGAGYYATALSQYYGEACWRAIDRDIRDSIAQAEFTYQQNRHLRDYDFVQASILLSKAIEQQLRRIIDMLARDVELAGYMRSWRNDPRNHGPLTLGSVGHLFKYLLATAPARFSPGQVGGFSWADVSELKEVAFETARCYRNDWAHEHAMPRERFEEFREHARRFFGRWTRL